MRASLQIELVSLTRPSHSQERVWYFTVQLIVLADSGCRVYMRSHSTQPQVCLLSQHPTKIAGSEQMLHCKVPDFGTGPVDFGTGPVHFRLVLWLS